MALDPQLPEWNPSGSAVVDPPSGKKAAGWAAGERPAARFFNWLFQRAYLWLLSLSTAMVGLATWDGTVSALAWLITGGPGVLFALRITALNAAKVSNASLSTAGATDIGVESIEGYPGIDSLFPNTVFYVYTYWDTVAGATAFEISLVAPFGAVKTADLSRRYLFPFYTNRRTVAGTDYGLPIPFVRHGAETRYLLNAETADRGLTVFQATTDETDPETAIDLSVMLPVDASEVCIRVRAYVSTANSGGMVHLYPETGTDSAFNAIGFLSANDQYNYWEVWVPLPAARILFLKLERTRAASPMTTELTLYVVGFRSPQP